MTGTCHIALARSDSHARLTSVVMTILIDGYNLLHASGVFGGPPGADSLQRSRQALLDRLVDALGAKRAAQTVVVFDATAAPPGLPRTLGYRGLTVRFASQHADADALIEELIDQTPDSRRLTVVSSDHRLHRAARGRGAKAIDSEVWFAELMRAHQQAGRPAAPSAKPTGPLSEAEVEAWLAEFDDPPSEKKQAKEKEPPSLEIFPPGYGEDLLDEEE